jgi:replication factor C subunit 3/5
MDNSDERLWAEKYQPRRIDELDYNENISKVLKAISSRDDFSHLIFYGAEGAGKKTRIRAFLSEIFGPGVNKMNTEMKEFKVNSTNVEYTVSSSNYHTGNI